MSRESIFELDRRSLQSTLSWEDAKGVLREQGENGRVSENGLTIMNHLLYIRAFSRVLVDIETYEWNKMKPAAKHIELVVAGTTNLTSDYDVTMVGPSASALSAHINAKFMRDTNKTLSAYADTNLYCVPFVKLDTTQIKTSWFVKHFRSIGLPGLYIPFPTTPTFLTNETRIALLRYNGTPPDSVSAARFMVLAQTIEAFIYSKQWLSLQCVCQVTAFTSVLHEIQKQQPGAYWTLSSMIVVVVEMQREVRELRLTPEIYRVCAIENMACVMEHKTAYTDVLKYVYRVLYCWDKCKYHYLASVDAENKRLAAMKVLVQQRGVVNFTLRADFLEFRDEFFPTIESIFRTFINTCKFEAKTAEIGMIQPSGSPIL